MKRIAVFASGGGTDFQSVIDANEREHFCEISLLVASKAGIGAIDRAKKHGIRAEVFSKKDYPDIEFTLTRDQTELLDYSINNLILNIIIAILLICNVQSETMMVFTSLGVPTSPRLTTM